MRTGLAEVGGELVAINDPRIVEFCDSVDTERALYEMRIIRGSRPGLAAEHAGNLAQNCDTIVESFQPADVRNQYFNYESVSENLIPLAVGRRSTASKAFMEAFNYVRLTRTLNVEYGPDASPAFKAMHKAAVRLSEKIAAKAVADNDPQALGWDFPLFLTSNILRDILDPSTALAKQIASSIKKQKRPLALVEEARNELRFSSNSESGNDYDDDEADDFVPEVEAEEVSKTISMDLLKNVDVTVVKLVRQLSVLQREYLSQFDPDLIISILGVGRVVLMSRGLVNIKPISIDRVQLGDTFRSSNARCRPKDGAFLVNVFFTTRGQSTAEPKAICDNCGIKKDCLNYALVNGEKFGVWGGLSERERRSMRKTLRSVE